MNEFWSGFQHALGEFTAYGLLIGAVTIALKWIGVHKKDAKYAEIAIKLIKSTIGKALGDKADAVFDVWMDALNQAITESSDASTDQIADKVVDRVMSLKPNMILSTEERGAIHDAAQACVALLKETKKPQVQMMSILSNKFDKDAR